jgi:hypothetical protein
MGVPLERNEGIRMSGDCLDKLDVRACCDQPRYAGMPEVVEAVAFVGDAGEPQRRVPDRCRKFDGWSGVPRIEAKTSSSGA